MRESVRRLVENGSQKPLPRFMNRTMRLAYLAPVVFEHLVIRRRPAALSLNDLVAITYRPWAEQMGGDVGEVNVGG